MTQLVAFFICLLITIILIVMVVLFFGPPILFLFMAFPVVISEAITGERGTFSPNGSGKKSLLFNLLAISFTFIQVLLIAGILFGIHWLIGGLTPAATEIITAPTGLSTSEIYRLQLVNSILWVLAGIFVVMLVINLFRPHIKQMSMPVIFFGYILPLLTYPLAFIFLKSSRSYLTSYPDGDHYLNMYLKVFAVIYAFYLVATELHQIYVYVGVFRKHHVQLGVQYWLSVTMGLVYKILFLYLIFSIFV